jgi:peptidoglycan/xylan/chitin deacetylase (PgdA/CDA1 family)
MFTGTIKARHVLAALVFGLLLGCGRAPVMNPDPVLTEPAKNSRTVVSLTFDDGDADNYAVRPVLAQYGLHATFFIPSGLIGTEGYMTEQQLRGLYEDGNEIGGHTLSHQKLTGIHGEELRRQICQDRSNLEALGFDVISFAYPFGGYEADTKQVVQECGYRSARIILGGPDSFPAGDPYALKAMPYIVTDTRLGKMERYVRDDGWVILTFHHVCSGCDRFSIDLETFTAFAEWLHNQQDNGIQVMTIGEVFSTGIPPVTQPTP